MKFTQLTNVIINGRKLTTSVACPPAALMFIQSFSKLHPLVQKLNEEGETYMRMCFIYTLPTFILFLISKKD
jgi:hypothetical protein